MIVICTVSVVHTVVHRALYIVKNCFKGHILLNYWLDFDPNLAAVDLMWYICPSLIIVQIGMVCCISRSQGLK